MPDFRNYPGAVIEDCELKLMDAGIPTWFIRGFKVSDLATPGEWGKAEITAYEWPQPIITTSDGWKVPFDLSPMLSPIQWQALELAAVARRWLEVFGDRSPLELALACEFSRLDALWFERRVISDRASERGKKGVNARREATQERDLGLVSDARDFLEGRNPTRTPIPLHNLVGVLHRSGKYKKLRTDEPLTKPAIRNILKRAGIFKKKK